MVDLFVQRRGVFAILALCAALMVVGPAWAKHEVQNINSSVATGVDPVQGPAEDLEISWERPTMDQGEVLNNYIYKLNNSVEALDDDTFNEGDNNHDGVVQDSGTSPFLTLDKAFFSGDDYEKHWYVHIKTSYLVTAGENQTADLSNDEVVGPFNFDNVAPQGGEIGLDPEVDGQTASTSSINPVTLKLTSPFYTGEKGKVYLSNNAQTMGTAKNFATTLQHEVSEGAGSKTVYCWFEDEAGNISQVTTLDFELTAGKTMDPSGDLQLELGSTQEFTILGRGDTETFTWEIIEANPADTASITVDSGVSIEVQGDKEGTFKVKATSDDDAAVYTSGTVQVVKSISQCQFNFVYNVQNTSVNAISTPFNEAGITNASELFDAIPNCDGLQWWDAATQSYKGYSQYLPDTNIAVNPGDVFFAGVSAAGSVTFEGPEEDVQFNLIYNDSNTSVNSISVPYNVEVTTTQELFESIPNCDGLQWWDAASQSYKGYSPYLPDTNIPVSKGDAFFVGVTQAGVWP